MKESESSVEEVCNVTFCFFLFYFIFYFSVLSLFSILYFLSLVFYFFILILIFLFVLYFNLHILFLLFVFYFIFLFLSVFVSALFFMFYTIIWWGLSSVKDLKISKCHESNYVLIVLSNRFGIFVLFYWKLKMSSARCRPEKCFLLYLILFSKFTIYLKLLSPIIYHIILRMKVP